MTHRSGATRHQFELRVLPHGPQGYGLALYQGRVRGHNDNGASHAKVVQIWGDPLKLVMDQALTAIKRAGYRPSDLSRTRQEPFHLREEDGVRLGLLFLALKPLRKLGRIEAIAEQVRGMEPEELFYWFSKTTGTQTARHAQRALRILMAEE
jgi:hypothetical protein